MCKPYLLAAALTLLATTATAETLCIQGRSFEPGREFMQTRRLQLDIEGPDPGEFKRLLAARGVREKLWPELQLDEIQVQPFEADLCGQEPLAELTLRTTPEDLAAIHMERGRGPADQPTADKLARGAQGQPAPAKLAPTGTPGAANRHEWFRLYYATTRQATGAAAAAQAYSNQRGEGLRYGQVAVTIPSDHRYARLESPSVFKLEWDNDPQRHITLRPDHQTLTAQDWKTELTRRAAAFNKPGVLLFIHGYNTSFEDAARRAAQLAYDLAFPGPTVLFSWPSDGDFLGYFSDEDEARVVWRQMAQVLDALSHLAPGVPVYVVAHSMGNRILTQGLAELFNQRPDADRAFKQVVLAAPDIGREEFKQRWLWDLKSANAPRYTLYASGEDLPVRLSAWLHGEPRLGRGGADITVLPGLDSIDATGVTREWFGLDHSYFGDNATLMSDLYLLINRGLGPEERPRLKPSVNYDYWEFSK